MVRPSPTQMTALRSGERIAFELAYWWLRGFRWISRLWLRFPMVWLVSSCCWRRRHVHGMENVAGLQRHDRVVVIANHRSFFDFFVITAVLWLRTRISTRVYYPVRSTFYYDHWAGPLVNAAMAAMTMFPPVLRDRKRGVAFNTYMVDCCLEELKVPGTWVGMHPEGTRNKGPDPYHFLPAKPGIGRLVLESEGIKVLPVFVLGMGNDLLRAAIRNLREPDAYPIDVMFGPLLDFDDLRSQGSQGETRRAAAERCMNAIRALALQRRELREPEAQRPPADTCETG